MNSIDWAHLGMTFDRAERWRYKANNEFGTEKGDPFGIFLVKSQHGPAVLKCVCTPPNDEWQHVSVSLPSRNPYWTEMRFIKELFWLPEISVFQFHPKKSENVQKHCLHLWRNTKYELKLPPSAEETYA